MCIPLRGKSVCILFISSERQGFFQLNFEAQIQVSIETFWHHYTLIWNIWACANHNYLLLDTIYEFPGINQVGSKLHWQYFLMIEVRQWFYQLGHTTFSKNVFWSVMLTLLPNLLHLNSNFIATGDISIKKLHTREYLQEKSRE